MPPRRLRVLVAVAAAAAAVAVVGAGGASSAPRAVTQVQQLESELTDAINLVRSERGLPQLRLSARLGAAAGAHTLEMADRGFFSHDSADGTPFWKRLRRFYRAAGYRRWEVGETMVWVSPRAGAAQVVSDWLASPAHRAVLLDAAWREVGVFAVHAAAAPGAFLGRQTTIVTADFGVRSR